MAQRRMFSLKIVSSDAFLDMPATTRELYFQLGMYADDDGFVNPKKIIRMLGASDDDLKVLLTKRFLLPFENGVVVIKHWLINNLVRKDFYQETVYVEQKKSIIIKENKAYTECLQNVNNLRTQDRIGKDRIGNTLSDKSDLGSIQIKNESYMLEELTYETEGVKPKKSKLGSKTMAYLAHVYLETHDIKISAGQTYNANKLAKGLSELYQECGKDVDECARRLRVGADYFKARNLEWNPHTIWKNWEIITKSAAPKSASEVRILN